MTAAAAGRPPLDGVKVVDFSRLFAGPYATMTLADLGAEVIKVESPSGDDARGFGPPFLGGEGMNFMALNRNKRSIVLDLKTGGGLEVARRLTRHADVVVENFRPGVADKLGIGFDDLAAANPGLVYCSISGFGRGGTYSDRPALDIILQAMTGVMDRQGNGGDPRLLVVTVADTYAAALAVQSVLAALIARGRDGKGQQVEVTLLEALIAAQGYRIISQADEIALPGVDDTCPYQAFAGSDGAWFVIAVVSRNTWQALCRATGLADLAERQDLGTNPGRVAARGEVVGRLEAVFRTRTGAEWLRLLERESVPCSPVRKVEDLMTDAHVLGRGTIVQVDHPSAGRLRTMGSALHLEQTPTRTGGPAPRQGEHTDEILRELGFTGPRIHDLHRMGAFGSLPPLDGSPSSSGERRWNRLDGKVALISGGARGQGAAHGKIFAGEGARVVLGDVRDKLGESVAAQLRDQGLDVHYTHLDVSRAADWHAAVGFAQERYGKLDVLVNNAGIVGSMAGVVEETERAWAETIAVNQTGVWLGMKHAIPAMRRAGGGAIVNTCSIWGMVGAETYIAYQASKGAVQLMTKSAALTYVADHIRVNSVCPGLVMTPLAEEEGEESNAAVIAATPMRRGAQSQEISWGVLYLVSDEASYVTGTELVIDGGFLAQ